MSYKQRYHPGRALTDPEAFYTEQFRDNGPRPGLVKVVGWSAVKLSKPTFIFPDGMSADAYFAQINTVDPMILSLSHAGKKRFHDVIGGLAAVFTQPDLLKRVEQMRVWAATPYLTDWRFGPAISRLGGISVNRSGDYAKYGVHNVPEAGKDRVTAALIHASVTHLTMDSGPGNMGNVLDIFPAGTKGAAKLREGVGLVAEQLTNGAGIPLSMASPVQETSNIPAGLVVAFGEPVEFAAGISAAQYVKRLQESQDRALLEANSHLSS